MTHILDQQRQPENELEAHTRESARFSVDGIIAIRETIDGTTVISAQINAVDPSALPELAEQIGAKIATGIVVLDVASNGLVGFVSKDLQKKFHAGNIKKKVAESSVEVAWAPGICTSWRQGRRKDRSGFTGRVQYRGWRLEPDHFGLWSKCKNDSLACW